MLVVIYLGLAELVGTGSYLPFMIVLVVMHLFAATAVYALISRTGGSERAVVGTSIFLLFGAGFEDLLWAFQIGFVLAAALGCWALLLGQSRPGTPALLLTIGVATQGIALAFIPGVAIMTGRWRRALWIAIPVAAYLTWLVTFGSQSFAGREGTFDVTALVPYVATGVTASFGSVIDPSPLAGLAVLTVVIISWRREPPQRLVWSAMLTLVVLFAIIGLVRAQLGLDQAASSRYLYVAAPLVLAVLASARISVPRFLGTLLIGLVIGIQLFMLFKGHAYLASIQT